MSRLKNSALNFFEIVHPNITVKTSISIRFSLLGSTEIKSSELAKF